MPATVSIRLTRNLTKQARGVFEKYNFEVGILQDKAHKQARAESNGLKTIAGGPARKTSSVSSGKSVADISKDLRQRTGINIFTAPFGLKTNKDILNFSKSFFAFCAGRGELRRVENYVQAIVRNPITRGDYGRNGPVTAKIKGFNRFMIDTGQLFKNITAKARQNSVQR